MAQAQSRARRRQTVRAPEAESIASEQALIEQGLSMLRQIDSEKARVFVQRAANGHSDDDVFDPGANGGEPVTYAERTAFLAESEDKLRAALSPRVLEAIDQQLTG